MLRLAVRVRAESELVLAELLELAPAGVEEVDVDADIVEFAVYGTPGEIPELPALRRRPASAGRGDEQRRSPTTGPSAGASSIVR